jgi:hypothetical protein
MPSKERVTIASLKWSQEWVSPRYPRKYPLLWSRSSAQYPSPQPSSLPEHLVLLDHLPDVGRVVHRIQFFWVQVLQYVERGRGAEEGRTKRG